MRRHPAFATGWRWASAVAVATAMLGCAVPEWQKPGTPAAQIAQDMGPPQGRVVLPEGGERWLYSRQPAGQQVYHFHFDAQQRLLRVEQVLQEARFAQLRVHHDRRDDVARDFGKPALIERVANFRGDIWTYRLHEHGTDRQAHVFIDPAGVVRQVMFTDEARSDPEDGRLSIQ